MTGLAKIEDMFGSISNDLVGGANQSQQCGSIEITWGFMFFTKINYGHCEIVTLILTIIPGPCDVAVRFWSRLLRCRENNICSKSPYISWFQSQSQFCSFLLCLLAGKIHFTWRFSAASLHPPYLMMLCKSPFGCYISHSLLLNLPFTH